MAETRYFCRNKLFLQKQAVSAERSTLGRNTERGPKDRNVSAESFCHYSAETIGRNTFRSFTVLSDGLGHEVSLNTAGSAGVTGMMINQVHAMVL